MIRTLRNLDLIVFQFINHKIHNSFFDFFFTQITHLGDFYVLWLFISLLLLIFGKKREKNVGLVCLFTVILNAFVTNILLQPFFNRSHPYDVLGNVLLLVSKTPFLSFPCGQSSGSYAFATVVSFQYKKFCWIPLYSLAGLIAFSRIYIGVHYPLDVIAGAITGTSVALMVIFLERKLGLMANR